MSDLEPCYRHADRPTAVRCTRCERPICPECMIDAPVGSRRDAVAAGEYYRLLTSAFVHDGLLHLAVNAWSMAVVGAVLETDFGRARFVALYLLSALGASVATFSSGRRRRWVRPAPSSG